MTKHKLIFIGKSLYTTNIFERESKRYGIQRAVSFSSLHSLKFGDPILLARYISPPKSDNQQLGQAEIFGYFTLSGLSHNLPKPVTLELNSSLNIIKTLNNPHSISRACGSYSIGTVTIIKDTLEELVQKIKTLNIHVNKHKWFITGKYVPLTPFLLQDIKFCRGTKTVNIQSLNIVSQHTTQFSLIWIYNYRQRKYMPKLMKRRFQQATKNTFIDDFNNTT